MRSLLYPLLLLAVGPGCQVLHRSRPVAVLVKDADTKKPIAGAVVRISYPLAQAPLGPAATLGETASDGVARLKASPWEGGLVVRAAAGRYLPEEKVVSAEAVEAIEPAPLFASSPRGTSDVVLELYSEESRPTVELIVPTGYRGLVKAELEAQQGIPSPPGRRRFPYAVSPAGIVRVVGPDRFRHVSSPDFTARYANGTPLTPNAKEGEIGFWCLRVEGRYYTFLVDTPKEYGYLRPRIKEDWNDLVPPGGEKRRHGDNHAPAGAGLATW